MAAASKQGARLWSAWRLVTVGSLAALVTAGVLCLLPRWHAVSWMTLLSTSFGYVLAAVLSGAAPLLLAGTTNRTAFRPVMVALHASVGWVWIPAIIFLLRQNSLWTPLIAIAASSGMAACLSRQLNSPLVEAVSAPTWLNAAAPIFSAEAKSAQSPYRDRYARAISACFHGAALTLMMRSILLATVLLTAGAFALTSHVMWSGEEPDQAERRAGRPAVRLALVAAAAVLMTTLALLPWDWNRALVLEIQAFLGGHKVSAQAGVHNRHPARPSTDLAYESVILWPVIKDKKTILIAPQVPRNPRLPLGRPVSQVIPFDGEYWYFKAPSTSPGPKAHLAQGNPLSLDVRSADERPLAMEAHQSLGAPIELTCCSKIQVAVKNGDSHWGGIFVSLVLTDSASGRRSSEYLGVRPVDSTRHETGNSRPTEEILEFALPRHAKIQKFDEITVLFLHAGDRPRAGAKIAIQQFALLPR
jgi:hypothetical protein